MVLNDAVTGRVDVFNESPIPKISNEHETAFLSIIGMKSEYLYDKEIKGQGVIFPAQAFFSVRE